jgi:hypothetical protein
MADRKVKVLVRHRNLNGDEIMFQRKVLSPWAVIFVLPFLLGFGYRWKDWKLLNQELYDKEEEIIKCLDKVQKLFQECLEIEQRLKIEKADIDKSTRETRGYSKPFLAEFKAKELPFKNQKWGTRPDGKWRAMLNPKAFKGLQKGPATSVREKMGLPDGQGYAVRTAYTPEDFKQFKFAIEDSRTDLDGVIAYKEPQQKKEDRGRDGRDRQDNRNNRNNRNNDEDDY